MADKTRHPCYHKNSLIKRRLPIIAIIAVSLLIAPAQPAQAGLVRGLMYILGGALEVPRATIAGTFGGPPIIGTLGGLISGTFRGIGMVTRGVLETGVGVLGLAKKYGPLIPIFL